MEITKKQINLWSKMGSRATFGLSLLELQKQYNDLMVLTSDVSTSAGLDRFRNSFPDKYVDVGISEQNLIGVATGLAKTGYNVITTTFSPFQNSDIPDTIPTLELDSNILNWSSNLSG